MSEHDDEDALDDPPAVDTDWDLDAAVAGVLECSGLPDDAWPAVAECLNGAGPGFSDGWLVVWWMPIAVGIDATAFTGNTMPSERGWNCVFVADRDNLLELVIDAADQGTACTVIDLEECL